MLYKIKNDYYILVGRKYIKVDFKVKGNNVDIVPDNKVVIEQTPSLVVTTQNFDDKFKESIIKNGKPSQPSESRNSDKPSRFGNSKRN